MKRRSVRRMLAMLSGVLLLAGETLPVFAAGAGDGETPQIEAAAEEDTTGEDSEVDTENDSVSEAETVSEKETVSENETDENAVSEDAAEKEPVQDNNDGDEEAAEEETVAADESVFDWNGNVITKYKGTSTTVVIPARAIEIGKNAFKDSGVVTVSFENGNSLITIATSAFSGCKSLKNFDLPAGVKEIGGYAFKDCVSLTEITLPKDVHFLTRDGSYGRGAFMNCTSLKKVKNVTGGIVVDDNNVDPPFKGCTALTDIEFASGITTIPEELFSMCTAVKTVTVPATVSNIKHHAFYGCTSLSNVVFESDKGLVTIGTYAFCGCKALSGFNLPSSVKEIGGYAFRDCVSLTEITLSKDVHFKTGDGIYGRGTFMNCTSLKKVKNVTGGIVVDDNNVDPPFKGCTALTDIEFASGITTIPEELFSMCTAVKTVTVPATVSNIMHHAFYGCTSLSSVVFESDKGLVKIGTYAFCGCSGLSDFDLPSSVKEIGGYAFKDCISLTEITLPKDVHFKTGDGIYGRGAFMNCTSLKKVKNVTGGIVADDNNVDPPFKGCTALADIEFAQGITKIPEELFSKCVSLRSVTIPNSVKTIEKNAFDGCSALREIHLPSKLSSVKESAFRDCISISEVYYGGKSTREKIKKASGKNNDYLFDADWIKESRSDAPKTGNLKLDGQEVNSLKDAFSRLNDKEKIYTIDLLSNLTGEKNLTIPKNAKSVIIDGHGYTVEITGTKLTANCQLQLKNVTFKTVDKKGNAAKFTINAKKGLIIEGNVSFDTKKTDVRSGDGVTVISSLAVNSLTCKDLSLVGTVKVGAGCKVNVKTVLKGFGGSFELAEGFTPINLGGTVEGPIKFSGVKLTDGTPVVKANAKKIDADKLRSLFNVDGITSNTITTKLHYYGGKACIFAEAFSYGGKDYAIWKEVVADMNAAVKAAKKEKKEISLTVSLKGNADLRGAFKMPAKGYTSLTISGSGQTMKFTSDITLTGDTTISGVKLMRVNKKGEQIKGKVTNAKKFNYNGPLEF